MREDGDVAEHCVTVPPSWLREFKFVACRAAKP